MHEMAQAGDKQSLNELMVSNNKKVLHCYKVVEEEWSELTEGIFSGARKRLLENIDE